MTDNEKKMIQDAEEKAENKGQDIVVEEVTTPEIPDDVPPDRDEQSELFETKNSFEQKAKSMFKNKPMALILCAFAVVLALILCSWSCISPANADNEKANDTNNQEVEVKDTTAPTITFSKEEVNLKAGESFDVPANIKVVDDTDGKLEEAEKIEEGKAGYVIDDEKVDLTKAGTYTVSVTAVDSAGNKAKGSFTVKVTEDKENDTEAETKVEELNNAENKSESSSSNSSATKSSSASNSSVSKNTGSSSNSNKTNSSSTVSNNSASSNSGTSTAAKPSTGSGSSAPSSTAKPSTGSSTSSGSSSASKPSTGSSSNSGSSGNSGGSATKPSAPEPVCKDVVVVDREAYDEQVLVKEAYDEQITVKEAWDEPYYVVKCVQCGEEFPDHDGIDGQHDWLSHSLVNDCENWTEVTKYIHHDAEYQTVHHDAEYQTVHHDAVTHVEHVCG